MSDALQLRYIVSSANTCTTPRLKGLMDSDVCAHRPEHSASLRSLWALFGSWFGPQCDGSHIFRTKKRDFFRVCCGFRLYSFEDAEYHCVGALGFELFG